jgi:beta-glucanase (GH16 family)
MKKIYPLVLLIFTVTACVETSSSELISSSAPGSSSGVPNGLEPLVPFSGCEVQTLDNDWVCTWADEFNGTSLNTQNWHIEVNGDGGGNQEAQYYRAENIAVDDGKLVITAKQESYLGKQYTSGRINSRYKVDTRFGRVAFRAKMPGGRGTWAAIWMLPLFNRYGQWPNSGEIDILEYVGYNPGTIYTATHTKKYNHNRNNNPVFSRSVPGIEDEFHDYEMIWLPGEIRILVDGYQYGLFRYIPQFNQDVTHDEVFPFHDDFYFIINLAVGGSWGGVQGIDQTIFPTKLEVDYLRLYQLDYARIDKEDPATPTGLATSLLKNTIHWNRAADDIVVSKYAIYLDGNYYREVNIHQFTFVGLEVNRSYQVAVQSIDFVGRTSPVSEPISFTFGG